MYLRRRSFIKHIIFLPIGFLAASFVLLTFLAYIIKLQPAKILLAKIPVVSQWIIPNNEKLVAVNYTGSENFNEQGDANNGNKVTAPIPLNQDIKLGAFKKEKVNEAGKPNQGKEIKLQATTQDSQGHASTKAVTTEVKLCKAGHLSAWAYLTVPDRPFPDMPKAPIKSPLMALGFPFATFPYAKDGKLVFVHATKPMTQIINDLTQLSNSYAKEKKINKDLLVKYYTDLFVFYYKAIVDKRKSEGFAAMLNSYLRPILPVGATDPMNMYLSARYPGELSDHGANIENVRAAYQKLFHALVYGDEEGLKGRLDINSPEYKACRNFIDQPVNNFHFHLETTVVVPGQNKVGKFVPIGKGTSISGFLKPPTACTSGDCFITLRYDGNIGAILFNQLGVCTAALGKYNGLTRLPQQRSKDITQSACEGTLCNTSLRAQDIAMKQITLGHVFDITGQMPLGQAVVGSNRSLLGKILDPFQLVHKTVNTLKFMLKVDETGLYNLTSISGDGYKKEHASIPIPVDCICPKASTDIILNKILSRVPDSLKGIFKGPATIVAKGLAATGHGVVWNCTFDAGALSLSSTFDSPEYKSHAAVAYNTFTRQMAYSQLRPNDPLKCPAFKIAQALGHFNGELPEGQKDDDKNKNSICSQDAIKQAYDANILAQPILLHQKALFTVCPPDKSGKPMPEGAPEFLTSGCRKNYLPLSVYSYAMGPMQLTQLAAVNNKLPGARGSAEDAKNAWNVIGCMIALYNNLDIGHMQFNYDSSTNSVEAEFVSDASVCRNIGPKEVKRAMKYFQMNEGEVKVSDKFINPDDGHGHKLFKD